MLGGRLAGPGPPYRRLAAALRGAVRTGDLAPGDGLPAERPLAAALGVSRATVVAAYDELRGAGAAVFARVALRHGVELVPGAATGPSGDHDAYVRLPFTLPEPRLVELVARPSRAWAAYGGPPSAR
ncbi:winged helix-turn-helix domain-containing protein [Streptomyces sp. NBC_01214]|uniref:winged helix-turn-helix domain-containing protein n=1 Tax=Streptomyces sp. NBC_01214 TaxID=2903777 RepID=UPI0022562C17|nr:winged helix-turn-helix domain-containing protein [Streptomyces sp. NBC_01214]MCX4806859.1 winged helix-turn-helix domain-containing protein [Streptomyces sp. NBC_01214]